jgi:hypothetical protein
MPMTPADRRGGGRRDGVEEPVMRIAPIVLAGLVASAVLAGCSAQQPVYDGSVAEYSIDDFDDAPKAVYANQVPLHPDCRLTDVMGSESWGDEPDSYSKGMGWEFSFPKERTPDVLAFYNAVFAGIPAQPDEDGGTQWTIVPRGAQEGEDLTVTVSVGELWIHENVKPRPGRKGS